MFSNFKKIFVAVLFGLVLSSQVVALSNDTSLCACQRPQAPKPANQQ